jgi:transposase
MAGRGDLTDPAWRRIAGRLPKKGGRGGQWRDHRTVINGLLWKLRPGAPWRDRPERYGAWQTWADRLSRWRRAGTWDRLLAQAQSTTDAGGALDGAGAWTRRSSVPTSLRGEPGTGRASPTGKGGAAPGGRGARTPPRGPDDEAAPELRRPGAAPLGAVEGRAGPRTPAVCRRSGGHPGPASGGTGPAAPASRAGHRGQGL